MKLKVRMINHIAIVSSYHSFVVGIVTHAAHWYNKDSNKLVIFCGIAFYCGDTYIVYCNNPHQVLH